MKWLIFDFWVTKTRRFNESHIIKAIREHEGGLKSKDNLRYPGISQRIFHKWKQKYGGMETRDVKRLNDLVLETATKELNLKSNPIRM